MKGKRYKAEIREKDNQKIEVLLRNWSHKSRTKDYKEEEEAMWLIYPKKAWSKGINLQGPLRIRISSSH